MSVINTEYLICIAKYLAFDLSIVLSCIGFGVLCDALWRDFTKGLERVFFSFVFGAGIWVCCVFGAGLCVAISKTTILVLFVLSLISLTLALLKKSFLFNLNVDWLSVCLMMAAFGASFWYSLYPGRFYDDQNYHLPLVQFFLQTHSIDPAWHLRFPVGNQATDLLFLPLQAFGKDIAAQQLSVVSFQVFLLGIYCCAKRFGRSVKAGQIALLACLTATHVLELSVTAYTDMNFALFVGAAIYAGLCLLDSAQHEAKRNWAIISGSCFGLSIASNLFGLVPLMVFILLVISEAFISNKNEKKERVSTLVSVVLLLTSTFTVSAPWFARNIFYTHNPIFPFASELFGLGGVWNANDMRLYLVEVQEDYGLSKALGNIISLPWVLSFPPGDFTEPSLTPTLLLACVIGVPLSFLPHSRTIKRLLIIIWAVTLVWFFFGHHTTYLLGIVPAVSVLTGISLVRFWKYISDPPMQRFLVCFFTITVLVFGAVGRSLAFLGKYCDPITATESIRSMLLDRWLPINRAFEFVNKLPAGNLYTYKNPNVKYLYKGTTYGDFCGHARFVDFASAARGGGESLLKFLNTFRINYVVVEPSALQDLKQDEDFRMHFHQLYSDDAGVVFELD